MVSRREVEAGMGRVSGSARGGRESSPFEELKEKTSVKEVMNGCGTLENE